MAMPRYIFHLDNGQKIYAWERMSLIPPPMELYARYGLRRGEKRRAWAMVKDIPMSPYISQGRAVPGMYEKLVVHMRTTSLQRELEKVGVRLQLGGVKRDKIAGEQRPPIRVFRTVVDKGLTMFVIDGSSEQEVMALAESIESGEADFRSLQFIAVSIYTIVAICIAAAIAGAALMYFLDGHLTHISDNETRQAIARAEALALIEKYKRDEAALNFYGVKDVIQRDDGSTLVILGNGRSYIINPDGTSKLVDEGNELPDEIQKDWGNTPDVGGAVSEAMINWNEIIKWAAIGIGVVAVVYFLTRPHVSRYVVGGARRVGGYVRSKLPG